MIEQAKKVMPYALVAAVVAMLYFGISDWRKTRKLEQLQQQIQEIDSRFWKAAGERDAFEKRALEGELKGKLIEEEITDSTKKGLALKGELENVKKEFEEKRNNLGDCASSAECARLLCEEYKRAGRISDCPGSN